MVNNNKKCKVLMFLKMKLQHKPLPLKPLAPEKLKLLFLLTKEITPLPKQIINIT